MPWLQLGIVTPNFGGWQLFPIASAGSEVFRVTFQGDFSKRVSSYILLRSYWAVDEVTQAIRVYPGDEKKTLELPIPQPYKDAGITVRYFGVLKKLTYSRRNGLRPDVNYQVRLEDFYP